MVAVVAVGDDHGAVLHSASLLFSCPYQRLHRARPLPMVGGVAVRLVGRIRFYVCPEMHGWRLEEVSERVIVRST